MERLKRFFVVATLLFLVLAASVSAQEAVKSGSAERGTGELDFILLLDKSLSMAPFFNEAKAYVAGQVLGPVLAPGDRLIVEQVYGKVERLYSGSIGSETEKAAAIRAIRAVKADGPFTDLGAALDAARRDVEELGRPDRPKYVLLITDERQEAPAGSPYRSPDYRLRHPALEYIKRVDLGRFRAIAVGLNVGEKIAAAAPNVVRFLSEPPPSRSGNASAGAAGGSATPSSDGNPTSGAGAPSGASSGGSRAAAGAFGPDSTLDVLPAVLVFGGAGLIVLVLAIIAFVLLRSAQKRKKEEQRGQS